MLRGIFNTLLLLNRQKAKTLAIIGLATKIHTRKVPFQNLLCVLELISLLFLLLYSAVTLLFSIYMVEVNEWRTN